MAHFAGATPGVSFFKIGGIYLFKNGVLHSLLGTTVGDEVANSLLYSEQSGALEALTTAAGDVWALYGSAGTVAQGPGTVLGDYSYFTMSYDV
jgi:hypothetical protein